MATMKKSDNILYLVTTLIEMQDSVSDGHALYISLDASLEAMAQEISECQANFNEHSGSTVLELPRCKEWRTEDGNGYTVAIEEIVPL